MNFTKDDITEEFENNLLELFLDKLSETPSKILNDEGDLMYTNYEALEVLQKVFEIIMQEDDFKIISQTLGE